MDSFYVNDSIDLSYKSKRIPDKPARPIPAIDIVTVGDSLLISNRSKTPSKANHKPKVNPINQDSDNFYDSIPRQNKKKDADISDFYNESLNDDNKGGNKSDSFNFESKLQSLKSNLPKEKPSASPKLNSKIAAKQDLSKDESFYTASNKN